MHPKKARSTYSPVSYSSTDTAMVEAFRSMIVAQTHWHRGEELARTTFEHTDIDDKPILKV